MNFNCIPFVLLAFSVLFGAFALSTWPRKCLGNSKALAGMLLAIAVWALSVSLQLVSIDIQSKRLAVLMGYIGIVSLPVLFILFITEYTRRNALKFPKIKVALWIVPAVTFLLVATNSNHGLFYHSSQLEQIGSYTFFRLDYGTWWWVHAAYTSLLILVGAALLLATIQSSPPRRRLQIVAILISVLLPIISKLAYLFGIKPFDFFDFTPVFIAVSGILLIGAVNRTHHGVRFAALEMVFNISPHGMVVLDNMHRLAYANAAAQKILGSQKTNILLERVQNLLLDPLKNSPLKNEKPILKLGGSEHSVEMLPIKALDGKALGQILIMRDLSETLRVQKELLAAQGRLALTSKVVGIDPWENNFISGESSGGDQVYLDLGYSTSDIPRTIEQVYSLVHPDDLPELKSKLSAHLSGKTPFYTADFRLRNKWGEYRWIANYGKVTERTKDGQAAVMVGVSLDINDRKKSEERVKKQNEELTRANAEKDKFFSIIAHDLRSPFQGFIGLAGILAEQGSTMAPEQLVDLTRTLQDSSKNIYELLENLLGWAMIKRGRKVFNPEKMKLKQLLVSVEELLKPQIDAKEHQLMVNVNPETELLADREGVRTILRNIISNAIKFTHTGGKITVYTKGVEKGFLVLGVEDNGIGMPTEIQNNLFNLSAKVSRSGTNNEPSTGLGLILCKELIEKHGGKIWVESEPNKGTTFWFTLPISA